LIVRDPSLAGQPGEWAAHIFVDGNLVVAVQDGTSRAGVIATARQRYSAWKQGGGSTSEWIDLAP
jgi:hypothetical protein